MTVAMIFMVNLHELGFELQTPGSAVRHASDCAIRPAKRSEGEPYLWKIGS